MPTQVKRVAIVGAGPSGAIAVHALAQENSFDVLRVFDRRSQIGGTWVYTPELAPKIPSLKDVLQQIADKPISIPAKLPAKTKTTPEVNGHQARFSDTSMHDHLETNIPASIMGYTKEPFPDTLSKRSITIWGNNSPFRHREVIRGWIEGIYRRHGYEKYVELRTTVELAEKLGNEWVLTLRKETPGSEDNIWWQESFDAIVVANGHYNVPNIPPIAGLVEIEKKHPGTVVHSKHYRRPEDYCDKRVIVVGASISAFDITQEVLHFAKAPVYSSLRTPRPVFGYIPFEHPLIEKKTIISHISSDSDTKVVFFSDGTKIEDVDHIIFGTGYTFSVPFLPSIPIVIRIVPSLYLHVFKQDDPTLAFIGGTAGGFTFRVFEWQAVAIARVFAGRATLPPIENQQKWVQDRLSRFPSGGFPFIKIGDDFEGYFETLRELAGPPKDGATGHSLPKFDPVWLEAFTAALQNKIAFWKNSKEMAERHLNAQKEGKPYDASEQPIWDEARQPSLLLRSKL